MAPAAGHPMFSPILTFADVNGQPGWGPDAIRDPRLCAEKRAINALRFSAASEALTWWRTGSIGRAKVGVCSVSLAPPGGCSMAGYAPANRVSIGMGDYGLSRRRPACCGSTDPSPSRPSRATRSALRAATRARVTSSSHACRTGSAGSFFFLKTRDTRISGSPGLEAVRRSAAS